VPTPRRTAEIDTSAGGARHRRNNHAIARNIDAGFHQQPAQALVHPRRRADALALDGGDVAATRFQVRVHY
jgi:hypothetical protein